MFITYAVMTIPISITNRHIL